MGYIYKITNDINGKSYIGKTLKSVNERFDEHLRESGRLHRNARPLYSAMKKYGKEHFHVEMIEETPDSILSERESYWIKHFDTYSNGYNATSGGDGVVLFDEDSIFTELILCPYPTEVAKRIGCSPDTVRSVAHKYGIDVAKAKITSHVTNPMFEKKEIACGIGDEYIKFESIADAARWLYDSGKIKALKSGVRSHISECAKGKRSSAYGYYWYYI